MEPKERLGSPSSKTNSHVQLALARVAGLGDVFGCYGTGEVDETHQPGFPEGQFLMG